MGEDLLAEMLKWLLIAIFIWVWVYFRPPGSY